MAQDETNTACGKVCHLFDGEKREESNESLTDRRQRETRPVLLFVEERLEKCWSVLILVRV